MTAHAARWLGLDLFFFRPETASFVTACNMGQPESLSVHLMSFILLSIKVKLTGPGEILSASAFEVEYITS